MATGDLAERRKKGFSFRRMVSIFTALCFVGIVLSGVVLFFTPPGWVVRQQGWSVLGLSKDHWRLLHLWYCLLFILLGLFHLFYNWRAFVNYLKNRPGGHFSLRLEWLIPLILCSLITAGSISKQPFCMSLLHLRDGIKHSQNGRAGAVGRRSDSKGWGRRQAGGHLNGQGRSEDRDSRQNGTIRNIGRLTVGQYCRMSKIDLERALKNLRDTGADVSSNTYIREAANILKVHPREVRRIIEK